MKSKFVLLCVFFLCSSSYALNGFEIGYGVINNFRMFDSADSDTGNILKVGYFLERNNYYASEVEFAFLADSNVFTNNSARVETASFLNFKNIFYLRQASVFSPYLSLGTALYGVNLWRKVGSLMYEDGTNVFADLNFGMGTSIKLPYALLNIDLSSPAFFHIFYGRARMPFVLSFGCQLFFTPENKLEKY